MNTYTTNTISNIGNSHSQDKPRYFGVHGSARAWLISNIAAKEAQLLVICKDRLSSEELAEDLEFFSPAAPIIRIPPWDTLPFEPVSPQSYISAQRIKALFDIKSAVEAGTPYIAVTSPEALSQKIIPWQALNKFRLTLATGAALSLTDLAEQLTLSGFVPVSLVENVGEFAVRGKVLDIFPSTSPHPIRVEFSEEGITSLRTFDSDTQRSLHALEETEVLPVRETLSPPPEGSSEYSSYYEKLKHRASELETPPSELEEIISKIKSAHSGVELLQAIVLPQLHAYFDYLSSHTGFVVCEEIAVQQSIDRFSELVSEREERFSSTHHLVPKKEEIYLLPHEFSQKLENFRSYYIDHLEFMGQENGGVNLHSHSNLELQTRLKSKIGSGKALAPLKEALNVWRRNDYHVGFAVGSPQRAERLQRLLLELDIDATLPKVSVSNWLKSPSRYPVAIFSGHLSAGVQIPSEKLVLVAEHEIFPERSYRRGVIKKTNLKRLLSSLSQLTENDFVVHSDYGIGIYRGLKHLEVEDVESDFLHIEYADSKLFLPIQHIEKVQRFVAAEGNKPVIDKLSSTRWAKTKSKIKANVATLAGDLIKLYAARQLVGGWRYDPYGGEDERFADDFAFDETPDQMRAIEETLTDMASDKPMDRLVCGDVGFGKTEVAIRAAYKSVQHARQVALLVPTTILAEQHKQTFSNRFKHYPVKIAALSRFYNSEENKKTLESLASGDLDIVIGTHRLLQKDVTFKDLGLVIIDEEHRFGVKHKELLKSMRKQVDVLSLTATPIPRTLHMSLLGIRDISVINSPPQDRRAIRTYTATYDDTLVRDAILRELSRGGQCFFVHNKIQTISALTAKLSALVPEARFQFAHGQMEESKLEDIMTDFLNRKIDVLISTTIVESGLDIPNANTIIIDRADSFGLAQLYQLRGRVGRSDRQAYCYFLVPRALELGSEAQKRLKVLQSLDDLGLGFNLAIRDLEIRGAGNLLGKEQSGSVLAVGFELYTKILKEAILNLKGQEISLEESIDPEVKVPFPAYIPDHYIPDVSERLVMYQRLGSAACGEEVQELSQEIEDRFGPLPREVVDLVQMMRLRTVLRRFGVLKAEVGSNKLTLSFSTRATIDSAKVVSLVAKNPKFKFSKQHSLSIKDEAIAEKDIETLRNEIEALLAQLT